MTILELAQKLYGKKWQIVMVNLGYFYFQKSCHTDKEANFPCLGLAKITVDFQYVFESFFRVHVYSWTTMVVHIVFRKSLFKILINIFWGTKKVLKICLYAFLLRLYESDKNFGGEEVKPPHPWIRSC